MFCGKCGNTIPDGEKTCPVCGAPVPGERLPNKKLVAAIVGVVAVIALVIILLSSGGGPESMAKDYVDALFGGSGEDLWDASNCDAKLDLLVEAGEIAESKADKYRRGVIKNLDELCEYYQSDCEKVYGENWSYEFEVTKVKDLKRSELRYFETTINGEDSDFEVTDGVEITVKVSVSGDDGNGDDDYSGNYRFKYYKVDSEWIKG